jgi:putative heme transporter
LLVPRVSAALGWRLLVVVAAVYVLGVVAGRLAAVVVPVAVAVLLAALLSPAVATLQRHGAPRWAATALMLVPRARRGVVTSVVMTFVRGVPALAAQLSVRASTPWWGVTSGALTAAATLGETVTNALLVLFVLIFLLHGGAGTWQFLLGVVPTAVHTGTSSRRRSGQPRVGQVQCCGDATGVTNGGQQCRHDSRHRAYRRGRGGS